MKQSNIMGTGNKKTAVIISVAVVIIVALVAVIFMLLNRKPPPAAVSAGGRGTVVVPENVDELREQINEPVQDGYYRTRMNTEWTFETAKTPSKDAYVENSTKNKRTVYFDLNLKETGELVFTSPYIPVGGRLERFALDADLEAGDYPATVKYHLVDDNNEEVSTLFVAVTIRVLS